MSQTHTPTEIREAHYKKIGILTDALRELYNIYDDINFSQIMEIDGRKCVVTIIEK